MKHSKYLFWKIEQGGSLKGIGVGTNPGLQSMLKDLDKIPVRVGDILVTQPVLADWQVDLNKVYRVGNQNIASMTNLQTEECAVLIVENGSNGFKRFIKNYTIQEYTDSLLTENQYLRHARGV